MYTFEKFNLRLFPLFLLVIGTVFIFSEMYIEGGVAGTFGALFSISFKGFNIDAKNMLIRHYDRFLWFYVGRWHPIPKPLYITVVRIRLSGKRNNPLPLVTPGTGTSAKAYKMNLVIESKERYISLTYGSKVKMLEEGLKISVLLNIKMLDHSTSEKKWIN